MNQWIQIIFTKHQSSVGITGAHERRDRQEKEEKSKARTNRFKTNGAILTDLLVQLFDVYAAKGRPPDVLSREIDIYGNPIIQFEWLSGKIKIYPYTQNRYWQVWERFNSYWKIKLRKTRRIANENQH